MSNHLSSSVMDSVTGLTVILTDDDREWDDPYIAFVDVHADATAEQIRAIIAADYAEQFDPDGLDPAEFWKNQGARIMAVLSGHVQVGWQVGGCDDYTLTQALHGFKGGM